MGRVLLSICGVVVALALAGWSQEKASETGRQQHESAGAVTKSATTETSPEASNGGPKAVGCKPGQDRRDDDLCAQWKAADAAQTAALAAWILGVIGTLVGGATLIAAWNAAHWAKEAAKHTEESAKAGWAAEKVSRESAERQLRAYVHVERAEIRWGNQEAANPQISLWIKNTGQTPARWFGLSSQVVATNDLDGVDEAPFDAYTFDPSRFLQWPALGAQGDTLSVPGNRESDRAILVGAFKDDLAVQIFGVLLYETIDGELMESEFWFVSRPPHRFTRRLKDGVQPNTSGLATFGLHEEVPRKMARASRVLKVYRPSERHIPNREPCGKIDED